MARSCPVIAANANAGVRVTGTGNLVGAVVFAYASRPLVRALGALYPPVMLFDIVATGNHFLFDAAMGGVPTAVTSHITGKAFRPFNFKTEDQARVLRAVQYISHPAHPWQKLRTDHPGQYEKPVKPVPDPVGEILIRQVPQARQNSLF